MLPCNFPLSALQLLLLVVRLLPAPQSCATLCPCNFPQVLVDAVAVEAATTASRTATADVAATAYVAATTTSPTTSCYFMLRCTCPRPALQLLLLLVRLLLALHSRAMSCPCNFPQVLVRLPLLL
jgi:hypothetical protein